MLLVVQTRSGHMLYMVNGFVLYSQRVHMITLSDRHRHGNIPCENYFGLICDCFSMVCFEFFPLDFLREEKEAEKYWLLSQASFPGACLIMRDTSNAAHTENCLVGWAREARLLS